MAIYSGGLANNWTLKEIEPMPFKEQLFFFYYNLTFFLYLSVITVCQKYSMLLTIPSVQNPSYSLVGVFWGVFL